MYGNETKFRKCHKIIFRKKLKTIRMVTKVTFMNDNPHFFILAELRPL